MTFDRTHLVLAAGGGSAALLLAAFAFQYLGGLAPCELCLWQRYPHAAAALLGAGALMIPGAALPLLGLGAALSTAAIGAYHTGVERGWWDGPAACSGSGASNMSAEDLYDQIMAAPLVRCDEVAWQMLGLSMASWNMLASLGLAAIWAVAITRRG